MPRRKKKAASIPKKTASTDRLARVLAKRKKAELIDAIYQAYGAVTSNFNRLIELGRLR